MIWTTGDQWRNNSRKNEETEPKQKQHPVVDVSGDGSKIWCCKEQYCIGPWNVRSMNQGKLEVVRAEEPEIKLLTSIGSSKKQESARKTSISALLTMPKPLTVWITINWKILKEMGISDHLTRLLRNPYAGQEATVRTGHGTTDWYSHLFQNVGFGWALIQQLVSL